MPNNQLDCGITSQLAVKRIESESIKKPRKRKIAKRRRPKTSDFIGVCFESDRKLWVARIRPANWKRRCASEAEAAAHYNAVAITTWPDLPFHQLNNLWKIRPNRGFMGTGELSQRVLDIDEESYALVNEDFYFRAKDWDWFIEPNSGFATVITSYDPATQEFGYANMHEAVFGGPCEHLNGNRLDNRRQNLILPGTRPKKEFCPVIPLAEPVHFKTAPEVLQFQKAVQEFEEWHREVSRKGFMVGSPPKDPRVEFPGWETWVERMTGVRPEVG